MPNSGPKLLGVCFALAFQAHASDPLQITNTAQVASGVELRWSATAATNAYTVQFQDTLEDQIWRIPESLLTLPLSTNRFRDATGTNASRFYRVIQVAAAQRGRVLSTSYAREVGMPELLFYYNYGILPVYPQYAVQLWKVVYETVTPLGARTIASGVLALPENVGKPLPIVSYQHGTITETNNAPSSMNLTGEAAVGVLFATRGYAACLPDYLGMGDSPGLHPYHHARSEATAGVDLLRAIRSICATNGFPLTNKLFLCGYSQGGHSTMALFRELELCHSNEFTVTACAPMAGAYDLSGVTVSNYVAGKVSPNPYYFLYVLAAYQDVYHFGSSLSNLLAAPYNSTLPPLIAGNTGGSDINPLMPPDPLDILKPELRQAFLSNPRHPLRLALQENDLYRWRPTGRLRLYHCSGDLDVDPQNSQAAFAAFQAAGATQVQILDPAPGADHQGCTYPSLLGAMAWFDSLK